MQLKTTKKLLKNFILFKYSCKRVLEIIEIESASDIFFRVVWMEVFTFKSMDGFFIDF